MQLLRSIMNKKNKQNTITRYNGFCNNSCKNRTRDKKFTRNLTAFDERPFCLFECIGTIDVKFGPAGTQVLPGRCFHDAFKLADKMRLVVIPTIIYNLGFF